MAYIPNTVHNIGKIKDAPSGKLHTESADTLGLVICGMNTEKKVHKNKTFCSI